MFVDYNIYLKNLNDFVFGRIFVFLKDSKKKSKKDF